MLLIPMFKYKNYYSTIKKIEIIFEYVGYRVKQTIFIGDGLLILGL